MNKYRFIDENRAHLHQLFLNGEWKPLIGTSTAVQVLSKPLTFWAAELAAVTALETDQFIPTIREEYEAAAKLSGPEKKAAMDALQKKYPIFKEARFAHYNKKNESADKGIDLHAELEKYVKGCFRYNGGSPVPLVDEARLAGFPKQVLLLNRWALGNVKRFISSEGHCYSERLWTGGITDLVFEDKQGRIGIMDFKSSKDAYLSQFIQCAGYDLEIAENGILDADGNLITKLDRPADYYAIFPFGAEHPEPQLNFDTGTLCQAFEACVTLHKINTADEAQKAAAKPAQKAA